MAVTDERGDRRPVERVVAHARAKARLSAEVGEHHLLVADIAGPDPGLVGQIGEADGYRVGKRVGLPDEDVERVDEEIVRFASPILCGPDTVRAGDGDDDVGLRVREHPEPVPDRVLADLHCDPRVDVAKAVDGGTDEGDDRRGDPGDAQTSALVRAQGREVRERSLPFGVERRGMGEDDLRRLCETDIPSDGFDEFGTDEVGELLEMLGHRRRGDMEGGRGSRDGPDLADGSESAQARIDHGETVHNEWRNLR